MLAHMWISDSAYDSPTDAVLQESSNTFSEIFPALLGSTLGTNGSKVGSASRYKDVLLDALGSSEAAKEGVLARSLWLCHA